jgi:predicted O-linked N-acetylglucosamine transferase (SPINDLY family)
MGVPTLCLNGKSMASRGAMAIMNHVGLPGFVADDQDGFVKNGLFWANNLAALAEVRATLRARFNGAALAQPALITDGLENAFRTMWKAWCNDLAATS